MTDSEPKLDEASPATNSTAMEVDNEEEPTPSPPPNPNFTLSIHNLLESSRSDHGLRGTGSSSSSGLGGDDHREYRQYCTRRLARLRSNKDVKKELSHGKSGGSGGGGGKQQQQQQQQQPKFQRKKKGKGSSGGGGGGSNASQGKNKGKFAYHPRPHPPTDATHHVHYSLVSLYSAERCWSHALELKAACDAARETHRINNGGGKKKSAQQELRKVPSPSQLKRHYVRRLRKAAGYATELEDRTRISCDDRTRIEARAYAGWMRGTVAMETGDWQTACTEFGSALTLCRALGQGDTAGDDHDGSDGTTAATATDLELRDYFTARADHVIEPLLRYCQYELQEGGMDRAALQDLMKAQEEAERQLLKQTALGSTTASSSSSSSSAVPTQLRSKLNSLRDEERLNEASGGSSMATVPFRSRDVPVGSKELRFDLLKIADLKAELEKEGIDKDSGSYESRFLSLLSLYDDAISLVSTDLKEYEAMKAGPAVNAKRFEAESLLGYVKYEKLKLLMARNEDMVNTLRDAEEEEADGDVAPKTLEQIAHLYDALLQDARAVAQLPGGSDDADDEEDEFALEANANVLRLRALRCYYVARMYALDSIGKHADAAALFDQSKRLASRAAEEIAACENMDDALIDAMEALESKIGAARSRSVACAYLSKIGGGGAGGQGSSGAVNILYRLDDFEAGHSATDKLVEVPPSLDPIAVKPTFFDIASNHVSAMPLDDLQTLVDEHQEVVSSGGLLGWFRRS